MKKVFAGNPLARVFFVTARMLVLVYVGFSLYLAFFQRLHEDYQGPRQLWIQDGSGHNTLDYAISAPWWSEATAFLLAHAPPKPARP